MRRFGGCLGPAGDLRCSLSLSLLIFPTGLAACLAITNGEFKGMFQLACAMTKSTESLQSHGEFGVLSALTQIR